MKPGAVIAVIVIIGGGVLLRWRRNARIEAREDAADVAQVLPMYLERKANPPTESDYITIESEDDAAALKAMFRGVQDQDS